MGTHSWGQWAKVKDTAELNTPPASPPVPLKPAVRPTPPGSPPPLPKGSISKTPTSPPPPPVLRGRIVGQSTRLPVKAHRRKTDLLISRSRVGRHLRPFLIGLTICVFTPICCCSGLAIRTSWVEARERAERRKARGTRTESEKHSVPHCSPRSARDMPSGTVETRHKRSPSIAQPSPRMKGV